MRTIGKHPFISSAVVIFLTFAADGFWPSLLVLLVGGLVVIAGVGIHKASKEDSGPLENQATRPIVEDKPKTTNLVRVEYRHPTSRRPASAGVRTYTFRWPHRERPVPGTWVELPSDYGHDTGIVIGEGQRSDYPGRLKTVGRIIPHLPRVPTEAGNHCAPVTTTPKCVEPWGGCNARTEVEFEYLHRTEIAFVLRDHGANPNAQFRLRANIVQSTGPSPAVVINGQWVGNVVEDVSPQLREVLRRLGERGKALDVPARLWTANDDGTLRSRVTVWLPEASAIEPPGPMPGGAHLVLPSGSKIQVTGEEQYLNELVALLDGEPEVDVVAELYRLEKASARSTRIVVGVRVYGDEAGALTPATSAHFLPLIEACDEEGVTVCCRAIVKGNQLKADVVLNAKKAGELSDEWIHENLYEPLADEFRSAPASRAALEDMWGDDDVTSKSAQQSQASVARHGTLPGEQQVGVTDDLGEESQEGSGE